MILLTGEGENEGTIQWSDKQIADLLDRTKEGIAEQKDFANDYLDSFKVASYVIKEEEQEEEPEEEVKILVMSQSLGKL